MNGQPTQFFILTHLDELGSGLILVAFSGGPDSTALLHTLHAAGRPIHAAHIHHHLRGDEANADAVHCAEFCRERSIPFTLLHVDVTAERERDGGGVQETARRLRYDALERCADATGAAVIATAHNRDDNAETILLNILRGAGTDGLRGIPERRGRIVRPLLQTSRAEIEAYCAGHGLSPRRDSSNDSTRYVRNEVRHVLMPYLREQFNPSAGDALLRLSRIARDESDYMDAMARWWLGGAATEGFDGAGFRQLAPALQRRVLRLWLKDDCDCRNLTYVHIEQTRLTLLSGQRVTGTLPGGIRLDMIHGTIRKRLTRAPFDTSRSDYQTTISIPGSIPLIDWRIRAEGALPSGGAIAIVRFWRPGDRMRFAYGRRKLAALFQEAKWPLERRYAAPLLVDTSSGEVVAIAGLCVSPLAPNLRFTAERIDAEPTTG